MKTKKTNSFKKLTLSVILLCIAGILNAQWGTSGTNIYNSNTGYVGIGTSTPSYLLDVNGGFLHSAYNVQSYPASSTSGGLAIGWNYSYGAAEVNFYNVFNNAPTAFQFSQKTGASTSSNLFTILGNGNVGIGTTTPVSSLEVNGAVSIDNTTSGGPMGSGSWINFTSGGVSIQENWGLNLTGSGTQPVKVPYSSMLVGYTSGGPNYGSGNLYVSGNVGIGATSTACKLDVSGSQPVIAYFRNGNYQNLLCGGLLQYSYNNLVQTNDNSIIWTNTGGGSVSNGFVLAPWQNSSLGMRIDGYSGNFTLCSGVLVNSLTAGAVPSAALGYGTSYIGFNASRSPTGYWTCQGNSANNGGAAIYGDVMGGLRFVTIPNSGGSTQSSTTDAMIASETSMTLTSNGDANIKGSLTLGADPANNWTTTTSSPYAQATLSGNWAVPLIIPNGSAIRTTVGLNNRYLGFGMVDANGNNGTTGWYWMIQGSLGISPGCSGTGTSAAYPMTLLMDAGGNATLTLSQNGWCDFVFDSAYAPMTIEEKEKYYKTNKHLPGIDSTEVIDNKGLNVNKNIKGILQNVEEDRLDITTLYKIIKQQQGEIEELKEELKSFSAQK